MPEIINYRTFKTISGQWWAEFHIKVALNEKGKPIMAFPGAHGAFRQDAIRLATKKAKARFGNNLEMPDIVPIFCGGK